MFLIIFFNDSLKSKKNFSLTGEVFKVLEIKHFYFFLLFLRTGMFLGFTTAFFVCMLGVLRTTGVDSFVPFLIGAVAFAITGSTDVSSSFEFISDCVSSTNTAAFFDEYLFNDYVRMRR